MQAGGTKRDPWVGWSRWRLKLFLSLILPLCLWSGKKADSTLSQRHPHAGRPGRGPGICSFTGIPGVFGGGGSRPHCRHTGEDLLKVGMKSGLQQAQGMSVPRICSEESEHV